MVRLLNAKLTTHLKSRCVDAPLEIAEYEWLGKKVLYEAHTMAVIDKQEGMTNEEAFVKAGITVPFEPIFPESPKTMGVQTLVLEACQGCNLRCRYCFVAHEYDGGLTDKMGTRMSFDVAREAIDKILAHDSPRPSIGFFGGEPLMNWAIIPRVVGYMRGKFSHANQVGFHVTTNGTLITEEIARFLGRNGFSMIISLEGDKATHNYNRPMANGKDSFETTMNALRLIKKVAPNISPRITLRSTFPWDNRQSTITEKLEFLNSLCDEGLAGWVSVEPAVLTEGCVKSTDAERMTFTVKRVKELIPEYEEATHWFINRIKQGKTPRFHHFSKLLERVLYANHAISECGAGKGYMSVGGDRRLYACHREQNSLIGNLDAGPGKEQEKWMDNYFFKRETCPKCKIRYICGGGCREEAIGYFGMPDHGGLPSEEAILKSYPVMCAFKNIFVRSALYILSEVGASRLSELIKDPMARRQPQQLTPQQMRKQNRPIPEQQRMRPVYRIYNSNRLPRMKDQKAESHVCSCGKCKPNK